MYVWRVWLVWLVCVCIASLWNASALRGSWRLWRKELRLSALWSPVGAPSVDAFSLYTPSQKGLYTPGKISSGEDIEEDSLPDTELVSPENVRFCSRVQYDGTRFVGWQRQAAGRTAQGMLEHMLSKITQCTVRVCGASRTDAGVHARGQAVHFDLPVSLGMEPSRLEFVLNRVLSTEMRMWNVSYAPTVNAERKEKGYAWHAITDARSKIYVYRLCTAAAVDPLRRLYYSHVYTPIDIKLFRYALSKFKGQHDFQAFANRVEKTKLEKGVERLDTVRRIYSIEHKETEPNYHAIEVHLDGALYRMVRNIVGTSLFVAKGEMDTSMIDRMLQEPLTRMDNRAKAATPEGLTLEHVFYDDY